MKIICLSCNKIFEIDTTKKKYKPLCCSKECANKKKSLSLRRSFIWAEATEEEKKQHLKDYYEKNVIKTDGCWDWKKASKHEKYIRMNFCRKQPKLSIHIYSWRIHKGEIPKGMIVCHSCDNRRCSNPDHLFIGRNIDNINDCINKKRHSHGIKHGMAKLNEEQVKEIRSLLELGVPMTKIGNRFNVSQRTIFRIKHGTHWKHVE